MAVLGTVVTASFTGAVTARDQANEIDQEQDSYQEASASVDQSQDVDQSNDNQQTQFGAIALGGEAEAEQESE